jgi:hypothetical protein
VISAAAVIALCLLSRPADAVELFGADLDIEIQIPDEDAADGFRTPRSDVEKRSFFNAARCECPPESGGEFQIEIELVRGSEGQEPES